MNDKLRITAIKEDKDKINNFFVDFGIDAEIFEILDGINYTTHKIKLKGKEKTSKIKNLVYDLSIRLGKEITINDFGGNFEFNIPNKQRKIIYYNEIREINKNLDKLTIPIGVDNLGKTLSLDLAKAPHLLIGGASGSGKSVFIKQLLTSMLQNYTDKEIDFIIIDNKMVEFENFRPINNIKILTETRDTIEILDELIAEMNTRYNNFLMNGVTNIQEFNKLTYLDEKYKYKILIIDEFSDLVLGNKKEIEPRILKLAQLSRASGIHFILATQRPTTQIVSGDIKANFSTRISFKVATNTDSRVILGESGAENLLGNGDGIIYSDNRIDRFQAPLLTVEKQEEIVKEILSKQEVVTYSKNFVFNDIAKKIMNKKISKINILSIIDNYKIGYLLATEIIEELEIKKLINTNKGDLISGYEVSL